jgi:glucosyl-3-phosphoglycerate synthase
MDKLDITGWFERRTFHYRQFEPAEQLRADRERLGVTVSVCIPARNEAATIGEIVRCLRQELLERARLIDEIVVVDGGSSDDTVAIARAEGAATYREQEILPETGPGAGKGEGLWKSLYVCRGDLVCWVDSDIRNIHPRFVYGLLGPLLRDPSIHFVKAFYQRPLEHNGVLQEHGGGRVTELVARPLLNLFWPRLAGLVQPLSGEYAGRRELLEQLPFSAGYGVELGLLVDVAARFGVDVIAQVDLERRVHRNQDMPALSRMSFGILQTALNRLEREGRLAPGAFATVLHQFSGASEGGLDGYQLQAHQITAPERPPIATLEVYRRRREAVLAGRG